MNLQVTPEDSQSMVKILKYNPDTPKLSLRHPKTSPNSIRHCRHHRISSKTLKVIIWWVSMRTKVEPSYHFSTTLKCEIFFTWSFWDIKIPKPSYNSFLKIIGLGHFLQFLGSSERYHLLQLLLVALLYLWILFCQDTIVIILPNTILSGYYCDNTPKY